MYEYDYSIIILTKDRPEFIIPCLESLKLFHEGFKIEILVGDTGTQNEIVLDFFNTFAIDLPQNVSFSVESVGRYHFSQNNNFLAKIAKGKRLVFLNNDTIALQGWLTEINNAFALELVEIVGPKLLYGYSYRVQHAGIGFIKTEWGEYLGYHPHRLRHSEMVEVNRAKTMPAVTGACLVINKKTFDSVKGFDEDYLKEAQDVDLCLKVLSLGANVLYWPKSTLIHVENGTRPKMDSHNQDRDLLNKKWKTLLHSVLENQESKFLEYDSTYNKLVRQSIKKKVLFIRRRARGDVLASTAIVKKYRNSNPSDFITFKTEYPELIDSSPVIDEVLHYNDYDSNKYDIIFDLTYESGKWRVYPGSWLGEMNRHVNQVKVNNFNFEKEDFLYPPPKLNNLEQHTEINFIKKHNRYIVISTGAGWTEREWTKSGWEGLVKSLSSLNYNIIQIGGLEDVRIDGTTQYLGLTLQENFVILKNAILFVTLDSYTLHIGITANVKTVILTCKTCSNTIYLPDFVYEIRNWDASYTPVPGCHFIGCRRKFGIGLEDNCTNPILKDLDSVKVINFMQEKNLI